MFTVFPGKQDFFPEFWGTSEIWLTGKNLEKKWDWPTLKASFFSPLLSLNYTSPTVFLHFIPDFRALAPKKKISGKNPVYQEYCNFFRPVSPWPSRLILFLP